MIVSDYQIKVINKSWYLVKGNERHGPYTTPDQAIAARRELAQVDVTATADQISRKDQARRQAREATGR